MTDIHINELETDLRMLIDQVAVDDALPQELHDEVKEKIIKAGIGVGSMAGVMISSNTKGWTSLMTSKMLGLFVIGMFVVGAGAGMMYTRTGDPTASLEIAQMEKSRPVLSQKTFDTKPVAIPVVVEDTSIDMSHEAVPISRARRNEPFPKVEPVAATVDTPPATDETESTETVTDQIETTEVEPAQLTRSQLLKQEMDLFQEIRMALTNKDYGRAQAVLGQHRLRFPKGALALERQAYRAILACKLQRKNAAEQATQFVERYPGAPVSRRVRQECATVLLKKSEDH